MYTRESYLVGGLTFSLFIAVFVGLWKLHESGEIEDILSGVVSNVLSGKNGYKQAIIIIIIIILGNEKIVNLFCISCKKGQHEK